MKYWFKSHPDEEQLILYYYGEDTGDATERHLVGCERCRAAYESLGRVLSAATSAAAPERGGDYGESVWARLQPRLPSLERKPERGTAESGWRAWFGGNTSLRWREAAAMAVLLVAAFLAGRQWQGRPASLTPAPATQATAQVRERILVVAVGDHLDRSQMLLVELLNTGESRKPVDITLEQQWAEDLVDANRLYRQTAVNAGKPRMAGVLDDLERVLLEIAHSPSQMNGRDLEELRRRIETQGILFKVRVLGSNLRQQERLAVPKVGEKL